jgi:DNA-binding beta-propeller fold protein YncE
VPTRRRIAGIVALAGLGAFVAVAVPIVREIMADQALDASYRDRAATVCPKPASGPMPSSPGPTDPIPPLALSGQAFVSHGWAENVSIVNLATGEITRLPAGIDDAHEVAVSPDGRWGVAADFGNHLGDDRFDGSRLVVFDLATKTRARVIDLGDYRGPHDLTFLPGATTRLAVTTQTTRHVIEVDVETGQVLGATETRAPGSHTMAVTADGLTAFTANQSEGTVSRLDLGNRTWVTKYSVGPAPVEGIAVTLDGSEVWVGIRGAGEVRIVDGRTGSLIETLGGFIIPDRMSISPDGQLVVITDWACEVVRVADATSRKILGSIEGLEGAGVAKVLPDSRVAIVALLQEGAIAMVDIVDRRVLRRHDLGRRLDAAAWGPTP